MVTLQEEALVSFSTAKLGMRSGSTDPLVALHGDGGKTLALVHPLSASRCPCESFVTPLCP